MRRQPNKRWVPVGNEGNGLPTPHGTNSGAVKGNNTRMAKVLIIVESPAKTKTLKNFLGNEYMVEASMGHVRDLPEKKLGVDIEHEFTPTYVPLKDRGMY